KKVVSNIIYTIVISICGYLVVANILHIVYLNQHEIYNFNSDNMTNIKNDIKALETNIKKINNLDNHIINEEDLKIIKQRFSSAITNIKDNKLLSYKGKQKMYLKEFAIIDTATKSSVLENINILDTLINYDKALETYLESYKYSFVSNAYANTFAYLETLKGYRYQTLDKSMDDVMEPVNFRTDTRVYNLGSSVKTSLYISELVLNIGGDHSE
ncbi:MAG: hypothetical protein PHO63_06615, partial [Bacilli bacterium]|nr:hypothetical protein [Bacilli bacterium]